MSVLSVTQKDYPAVRYAMLLVLLFSILGVSVNFSSIQAKIRRAMKGPTGIFWLWTVLFLGTLKWGQTESESLLLGNASQLIAVTMVGFATFLLFFGRLKQTLANASGALICLILYAVFGIISAVYSPFPTFSLYKATVTLMSVLLCLITLSFAPRYEVVKRFIHLHLFLWFFLILSVVVGALVDPAKATEYKPGMAFGMLKGWLIPANPNGLAMWAGVLGLFGLNRFLNGPDLKEKIYFFCLFGANMTVMVLAQSRTCTVAFVFGVLVLFSRKRLKFLFVALLVALPLLMAYGVGSVETGLEKYIRRGQSDQQFETWSGRSTAWKYSWEKFKESPVLGYGMGAGVRFGAVSEGLKGSHLHSSYFEVLLNSGLWGFIPWAICLFLVAKNILKKFLFPPEWFSSDMLSFHTEISAILVFLLIRSIAGTTFVLLDPSFMLYLSLIGYYVTLNKMRESPQVRLNYTG